MKTKTVKVDYPFYKIVGDGGMSSASIGEGRFIPALIIDIDEDIEVSELIKLHSGMPPGDTELQWSLPKTWFSPKSIYLNLSFIKPMKINFGIEFELKNQYSLVDGIIHSRGFYLISGKTGDKVSQYINNSILIEVPNMEFDKKWNEILTDTLRKKYKEAGVPKKELQNVVSEHIKSMREIWSIRKDD